MERIGKGIVAGIVATLFLSVLMALKTLLSWMPQLDIIGMLAATLQVTRSVGWVVHLVIGIVIYGLAIALIAPATAGRATLAGLALAVVGWLFMMIVLMPMGNFDQFAMALGFGAPVLTLLLHLLFGATLGWTFAKLANRETGPT